MDTLISVQIIFYIVASIAIISLGILLSIAAYQLIYLTKNLRSISENINNVSAEVKEKISAVFEKLSNLPFLSFFSSKSGKKKHKTESKTKGRSNS